MSLKWGPVEWSQPVESPSFWASVQPAAPVPLLAGHLVLWNPEAKRPKVRWTDFKTFIERGQAGPKIQPLLTLWHGHWQTLWPGLFSSNWRFGHWDTNTSNVWVVPVRAIVSTPVVIPSAAYRLRTDMRRRGCETWGLQSLYCQHFNFYIFSCKPTTLLSYEYSAFTKKVISLLFILYYYVELLFPKSDFCPLSAALIPHRRCSSLF